MEERQITVDGVTTVLDEPFMVMATQNPIESYGTFPLPEAQTDRFFMRISLGYMTREQELGVIARPSTLAIINELETVVSPEETEYVRNHFNEVRVSPEMAGYMMDIIERTRSDSRFLAGVSTRGAIALYKASQVTAAMNGREYVIPEDILFVAKPVLCHRITFGGNLRTSDAEIAFRKAIEDLPVPLEGK